MTYTVIIAHRSNDASKALGTQVSALSDELVILEAGSIDEVQTLCSEYGCALLLIDAGLCPAGGLSRSELPEDTAILVLLEPQHAEKYLGGATCLTRNCNILLSSAPEPLLQHHVQLLLKQRTTTRELLFARKIISRLSRELESKEQTLRTQQRYLDVLSERDGLTGLYNRKHLTTILRQEYQRARRYKTDLSLLLLDIDHLKNINQEHGHLFGDFVLNEIAAILTSNTRDYDICFRFGGGNFIILLPQSSLHNGHQAATKLRRCCCANTFDNGQNSRNVTVSIGVASTCDSLPDSPDHFINMADRAMYQAKAKGRNRCQMYQPEEVCE